MRIFVFLVLSALCAAADWSPTITPPLSKKSANYFVLDTNGSYTYAFDDGDGLVARQSGDQTNEVSGHYTYYENGIPYLVKYTAGVQGYQPEVIQTIPVEEHVTHSEDYKAPKIDPRLLLHEDCTRYKSPQSRLTYKPLVKQQPQKSLSQRINPIEITISSERGIVSLPRESTTPAIFTQTSENVEFEAEPIEKDDNTNNSYSFSYSSDQSTRREAADENGNVVGKYSYTDDAGFHDLTYKAGDDIGFVVIGGNLAEEKLQKTPPVDLRVDVSKTTQRSRGFKWYSITNHPYQHDDRSVKLLPEAERRTFREFRRNSQW